MRNCLKEPIPQIFESALMLSDAVTAHLAGDAESAASLLRQADLPIIRDWTESIWGKYDPEIHLVTSRPTVKGLPVSERPLPRMPNQQTRNQILIRDGYHCRFCGIPVVPAQVRARLAQLYPNAVKWGRRNVEQHAALQCMWLQFDHILPNERGGKSDVTNVVVTCAPCNFGRMQHTIDECELHHPLTRPLAPTWAGYASWDGLIRLLS